MKNMLQETTAKTGTETSRSKGILDVAYSKLWDRPILLEEELLKTPGVLSAEINAFSNRIRVEFNPSKTSLDRIKKIIGRGRDS